MARKKIRVTFDADYYRRFYGNPDTAVTDRAETQRLVDFVLAYLDWLGLELRSVLDLGCGIGLWQKALHKRRRALDYTGVELSEHLCEKHGWRHDSVTTYRSRRRFDLVVCQGVLPYLSGAEVDAAIGRLAKLCRGALYLEAVTRADWTYCDTHLSDDRMHLRSAAWYRKRLRPHFINIGGGLFLPANTDVVSFELGTAK